jgi:hypothetical protein
MMVAHAIATGLLQQAEVAAEVREAIAGLIALQCEWAKESGDESEEPA